ncbi:MAG: TraR/DksA C4-type zinc finger protein [bacterium]|nr:TraR/DksA C4-type zinc finger protein [bacterium]
MRKIEELLLKKQRKIEEELESIKNDDPVSWEIPTGADDSGDESSRADIHAKLVVIKKNLSELSQKVKMAIVKIHQGTYGQCEKCGHTIEQERLKIIPMAVLCSVCVTILSRPN